MAVYAHRRQVQLFLAAILLPCVALVALGLRLVVQERELAQARLGNERRRVTRDLSQELSSRLEGIALRQVGAIAARPEILRSGAYEDSTVALVAVVSDGRLVLPWERDERGKEARRLLGEGIFSERIRQAEQAEFAEGDAGRAIPLYRAALEAAGEPVQMAQARLALARSLAAAGRPGEAQVEYRRLVASGPGVLDPQGIPFALYAASQLLPTGSADTTVLGCLRGTLLPDRWPSPSAVYLLRDLASGLLEHASDPGVRQVAGRLVEGVSEQLIRTERALALQRDLPGLGLIPARGTGTSVQRRWLLHGSPPWLVGTAPVPDGADTTVVAIRSGAVLASLESGATSSEVVGEVALMTAAAGEGEPLGLEFPGLVVRFSSPDGDGMAAVGTVRRWFYLAGLFLVIGVTLFGAYLLWRDVRREVELAATRSGFVSAVSHELKTPLAAIRMFAETLQMGRPADRKARDEYLGIIVNESERLTRLLNNVLDFSKIEEGRKTYRREPHCLGDIVRVSARAMQYPLEQGRFALHVEIDDALPPARVDRDAIEQAILNLIANAMKYSGDSRDIDLRLRGVDGEAVIEVADRGVGIEPAEQERIFERFYRVTSSAGDGVPGTGLGLTLVRHIVHAHGGRVEVESTPGEGSTFALFIPLEGVVES